MPAPDPTFVRELIAEIVSAPEDDAPRLVLSDYLSERGDPRGELIRVQCALARLAADDPSAAGLRAREAELLSAHGAQWVAKLTPFGDRAELERGLLRSIHRSPAKLLDKAQRAALAEVLPWLGLDTLVLRGATKKAKALGEVEALAWTPTLWWYDCQLDDAGVEAFVGSEQLSRLSTLMLEKLRCGDLGLEAIAQTPRLPRLRALRLEAPVHGGTFTIAGVRALLESERLPLEDLSLTHAFRVDLRELADSPALARLTRLHLGTVSLRGELLAIASSRHCTRLRELAFDPVTPATDAVLRALLDNPALAELRTLSFKRSEKVTEGVLEEARQRWGKGLVASA